MTIKGIVIASFIIISIAVAALLFVMALVS